jgi:hypothetical protein
LTFSLINIRADGWLPTRGVLDAEMLTIKSHVLELFAFAFIGIVGAMHAHAALCTAARRRLLHRCASAGLVSSFFAAASERVYKERVTRLQLDKKKNILVRCRAPRGSHQDACIVQDVACITLLNCLVLFSLPLAFACSSRKPEQVGERANSRW